MAVAYKTVDHEYLPATAAGKYFGYTKDYMLMLIKSAKITGRKVGNKWHVHIPSAEQYFQQAQKTREARRQALSQARKAELHAHVLKHAQDSEVFDVSTPLHTRLQRVALLETVAIVVLGVAFGTLGYGTFSAPDPALAVRGFFTQFVSAKPEAQVANVYVAKVPDPAADALVSMQVGTTTHTSLIVAPAELFTLTTVEEVQASFADPVTVSVDPENPYTGIVTPHFKSGDGDEYRFLMVPVNQQTP